MAATVEFYEAFVGSRNHELGYLVVSGATRDEVARILGVDLADNLGDYYGEGVTYTGWALGEIAGGILGVEPTGFGDPSLDALRRLSAGGRAAAVVRDNVLGHVRFGCARNGEIVFDSNEYMYIEDPDAVPDEIRDLFMLAWNDLEGDDVPEVNELAVAWAMAEVVTGVPVTDADVHRTEASGYFKAPTAVYTAEDG
jgi:hypothetical protein